MKRTVLTAGVVLSALVLMIVSDVHAGWVKNGALVTAAWNTQRDPQSCTDGAGGVIIVWEDRRINAHFDIYVQRLDPDGNPIWTTDGVPICIEAGDQNNTRIIADGMGGAIIVWEDPRAGDDIYAQRVDGGGTVMWDPDGVEVCIAAYDQLNPALASDGAEGAIVTWQGDRRWRIVGARWRANVYERRRPAGASDHQGSGGGWNHHVAGCPFRHQRRVRAARGRLR